MGRKVTGLQPLGQGSGIAEVKNLLPPKSTYFQVFSLWKANLRQGCVLKRKSLIVLVYLVLATGVGKVPIAGAASSLSVGGSAKVQLHFRIIIPQLLYLQIGSEDKIVDVIDFQVIDLPGTGRIIGNPKSIPVRVAGCVSPGQSITLTANSATPLRDKGRTIPFQTISWNSNGNFSKGTFNGGSNQKLEQWQGSGKRTGSYSFSYNNTNPYPAGSYHGTITYTLSTP